MRTTLSWTGTMCLVTRSIEIRPDSSGIVASHVMPAKLDSYTGARHAAGGTLARRWPVNPNENPLTRRSKTRTSKLRVRRPIVVALHGNAGET